MLRKNLIRQKFRAIGARLKFEEMSPPRSWERGGPKLQVDVKRDKKGEYFSLHTRPQNEADLNVLVLDVQPNDRHLLLMVKEDPTNPREKFKFLCGHDERFFFVASVPEAAGASNVREAKEALKPARAHQSQEHSKVKHSDRNKRRNAGFVRQGEWFFIPCPDLDEGNAIVFENEPISRGRGSKPHVVDSLFRKGGETVYVSREYPTGLTEEQYRAYRRTNPHKKLSWQTMTRDPTAYAKGRVRHPDHKTVFLAFWHRIEMNTEAQARGVERVAFLD